MILIRIIPDERTQGFIGSFDLPWSEWSLISDPDPDHPRVMHPRIHRFIWPTIIRVISDQWSWSGSSQRDVPYNHGQKPWDTFAFLRRFPIHTGPTPPLTPQTMLDACIQNFFRVSTLYRVGGGRTARKFRKWCTVLRGNREMTEKYEYCSTVPRTFVQDCTSYVSHKSIPWGLSVCQTPNHVTTVFPISARLVSLFVHSLCLSTVLSTVQTKRVWNFINTQMIMC